MEESGSGTMTNKEALHNLVDELPEDHAELARLAAHRTF
jgi:hypothetical protein